MKVLFEFYDMNEPILNVVSALVLKPDKVVFVGGEKLKKESYRRPMENTFRLAKAENMQIEYVPVDIRDYKGLCAQLENLFSKYEKHDCMVDISGGSDICLLAVGQCCAQKELTVLSNRIGKNKIVWLMGADAGKELKYDLDLSIAQSAAMSGGEFVRNGHADPDKMDAKMLEMIPKVFEVYKNNRRKWPNMARYFQQLGNPKYWSDGETNIRAPKRITVNGSTAAVDAAILSELADAGAVDDIYMDANTCSFRFLSSQMADFLKDVGIWLELYLYTTLKNSGMFDSLEVSTVVSWDNDKDKDDIINEIDLVAISGVGKIFVSCKTAVPDNSVLNEIKTLSDRFGGSFSTPVIATMCDLKKEAPAVFRRAMEMGVSVIDMDDLEEKALTKRFEMIKKRFDR